MSFNIEITLTPSNDDVNFLTQKINEESLMLGIQDIAYPFSIFLRNHSNEIIGGCNGSIFYGAIYTDQLWVHENFRRQGLGRLLMENVHKLGLSKDCSMAVLCTMSFQGAQEFYSRLGYVQDFERPGYSNGGSCLFLRKMLV